MTTPAHTLPRPVLLFSGHRLFSRWAARIVTSVDRRGELALLPVDHEEAGPLLASVPEERRGDRWWLVLRDGSPVRGDRTGALLFLIALWIGRPVGRVPRPLRVSSFLDTLDRTVARDRARLGATHGESPGRTGSADRSPRR